MEPNTTFSITIPTLTTGNFYAFASNLKISAESKGIWEYIFGDEEVEIDPAPTNKKHTDYDKEMKRNYQGRTRRAMAYGLLHQHIDSSNRALIAQFDNDPFKSFAYLKSYHISTNKTQASEKYGEFLALRLVEAADGRIFTSQARDLINQISAADAGSPHKVRPDDQILVINVKYAMSGPVWDNLKSNLRIKGDDDLTFDQLLAHIDNVHIDLESSRIKEEQGLSAAKALAARLSPLPLANRISGRSGNGGGVKGNNVPTCTKCSTTGHVAAKCWPEDEPARTVAREAFYEERTRLRREKKESGHVVDVLQVKLPPTTTTLTNEELLARLNALQAQVDDSSTIQSESGFNTSTSTISTQPTNRLLLDSGASVTMSNDKSTFINLKRLPNKVVISTADGSTSLTSTEGGTIRLFDPSNIPVLFPNAILVPGLTSNLFAISQLTKSGRRVEFDGELAKVFNNKGQLEFTSSRTSDSLYSLNLRPHLTSTQSLAVSVSSLSYAEQVRI